MRGMPGSSADPMRNAGLASQMFAHEYERDNVPVSDRQRKLAYVVMAVLSVALIGMIAMFIW